MALLQANHYSLLLNAANTGTVAAIHHAAEQIFQAPVMVVDTAFRLLDYPISGTPTGDPIWDEINQSRMFPYSMLEDARKANEILPIIPPRKIYYTDTGAKELLPRLGAGIFYKGTLVGYINVLLQRGQYEPWFDEALLTVTDCFGAVIGRSQEHRNSESTSRSDFARDLFHGVLKPDMRQKGIQDRYITVRDSFQMLVTYYLPPVDILSLELLADTLYRIENNRFFILLSLDDTHTYEELFGQIRQYGYRYGLSLHFYDLLYTPYAVAQANEALKMGMQMHPQKMAYEFSSYALDAIIQRSDGAEKYLHPSISFLSAYDKEHGTDYLATLTVYFQNALNIAQTSAALHIHRNTLYYRLDKISELCKTDLNDMNILTQMYLSLRSREKI